MGLVSQWRFEKADRKSDSCSTNRNIRTKLIKAKIDKSQKDTLCRPHKKTDGSTDHVLMVVANLHRKSIKEGMYNNGMYYK